MDIINPGNMPPVMPQNNQPNITEIAPAKKQENEKIAQAAVQPVAQADRVEISANAKIISKAVAEIEAMPAVREEAVQKAVQARVIENSHVPASELAAKLLLED